MRSVGAVRTAYRREGARGWDMLISRGSVQRTYSIIRLSVQLMMSRSSAVGGSGVRRTKRFLTTAWRHGVNITPAAFRTLDIPDCRA